MCDPVSIGLGVLAGVSYDSAKRQRKAANAQQADAKTAIADDARATAKAEADAVLAVNARTAASKQRRRGMEPTASTTALEAGAPAAPAETSGSVLGSAIGRVARGGSLRDPIGGASLPGALPARGSRLTNLSVLGSGAAMGPRAPAPAPRRLVGGRG